MTILFSIPIYPTDTTLPLKPISENLAQEGVKKKKCRRSKANDKRRQKQHKQKVKTLKGHLKQHLARRKITKQEAPAPLHGVNPSEFFRDLVAFEPTKVKRVPLESNSAREEKDNNKPSVTARGEAITTQQREEATPKLLLIPITIAEPTTAKPVNKSNHLKEPATVTPAESQDILADFISAAEQDAQEYPLTIDDDYLDIFDEEQIESPYEPVSISGRKTPEVTYTPTSIIKSEDKCVSTKESATQQETILELERRGILPVPTTREPSAPREFDCSDLPPREIAIKANKTKTQKRKEYRQRRKQRGSSTPNPGIELPGRPDKKGKVDHDARSEPEHVDNSGNQRITRANAQTDPSKREEVEFYAFNSGKTLPRTPVRPTAPSLSQVNLTNPNPTLVIEISSSSEVAVSDNESTNRDDPADNSDNHTPPESETSDSEEEPNPSKMPISYNISVKDVLELVQKFDGTNLTTFFSQIEDAKAMVGADGEAALVMWLKIKLPLEARKAIAGTDHKTVTEFKQALEKFYCTSRSIPQLQGELGNIYQKQDESVLSYANRIREIERQIHEVKKGSSAGEPDGAFTAELSAMILESFKRGINRDLYPAIRGEKDLKTIVSIAIKEEKEFYWRKNLQPTEPGKKKIMAVEVPIAPLTEPCQLCKKPGHTAKSCPDLPKCQFCQKIGHTARDCKRELTCQYCQQKGHKADTCWKLYGKPNSKPNDNNKLRCERCKLNHKTEKCRTDISKECTFCKIKGHTVDECRNKNKKNGQTLLPQSAKQEVYSALTHSNDLNFESVSQEEDTGEFLFVRVGKNLNNLLLLDTGAEGNLINQGLLPDARIDRSKSINLHGIDGGNISSVGRAMINIYHTEAQFHVLPDEIDLIGDGILGSDFLFQTGAIIDFGRKILQIGRMAVPLYTRREAYTLNTEITELPTTSTCCLSDTFSHATLTQEIMADLGVENTRDNNELYIFSSSAGGNLCDSGESRIQRLRSIIDTSHLDTTELDSINSLLQEHSDRFYLEGDELPATNVVEHKITTVDDIPVNQKQYRLPHSLREEVKRQVDDLYKKGIIRHSRSPYSSALWVVPKKARADGVPRWRVVDIPFVWDGECEQAFEILKTALCTAPLLQYPDFSKPFIITTDASEIALGGILSQGMIGQERPIAYTSRVLRGPELRYEVYEKEALAIVHSVQYFRPYIYGRHFKIYTDHRTLVWFKTAELNTRVQKWRFRLAEFDFQIIYKEGKSNTAADALSRNPPETCEVRVVTRAQAQRANAQIPEPTQQVDSHEIQKGPITRAQAKLAKQAKEPTQQDIATPRNSNDESPENVSTPPDDSPEITAIPPDQVIPDKITASERRDKSDIRLNEDRLERPKDIDKEVSTPQPLSLDESKEPLELRQGAIMYFVSPKGLPLETGALGLEKLKRLDYEYHLDPGEVALIKDKRVAYQFVACLTHDGSQKFVRDDLFSTLLVIKHLALKKKISGINFAKSKEVSQLPWADFMEILQEVFQNEKIKLIKCLGALEYVPPEDRDAIFYELHRSPVGGHRGISKTYQRIKQKYVWDRLKTDIQRRIQQCLECQLKKLARHRTKQPMIITDCPGSTFDKVALDIVRPLPATSEGNIYILTMQDQLSKFCISVPLPDATATTIADAMVKRLICTFGTPKVILTDQGRNFLSKLLQRVAKRFRIKQVMTTAFHAQSNGSLERSHHALAEFLKQYTNQESDWDQWIELATLNYNSSVQESTKHTPFEVVFGRLARLPSSRPLRDPAAAIIGYDCNSNSLNVTTVSLLGVEECRIPRNTLNVTRQYIQLLQLTDYQEVEVLQCKVELHRTVQHCGMHSHTSAVQHGIAEYISEISKNACEDAHLTGVYNYGGNSVIRGLKVNSTTSHPVTLAGTLTSEGACSGTSYADPYGSWNDVVVQATIKITLASQTARVDLDNNKLYLRSGTTCNFRDNYCIDSEGGYSYWHTLPKDYCKFSKYSILYEGYAERAVDPRALHSETLYSVTTEDITFALTVKKRELICGYRVQKTEHPKLLIFETRKGESFAEHHTASTNNLDIFAYINSKFIYVEKHMRTQIQNLYHDVLYQRCTQERETIKNSLAIAHSSPDQFAYNLMKGPGYKSLIAGEIVHIMRCIPVEVRFVHSDECYAELKVSRNNQTMFLLPKTHILVNHGTQTICNKILPPYFLIDDQWFKIVPGPVLTVPPLTLKPNSNPTWTYTSPQNLATSGIYSDKDLSTLRKAMMFPVERPALLNEVARDMHSTTVTDRDGAIFKLINDHSIDSIIASAWSRMWSKFTAFGNISAGIIAILVIIHVIKGVVSIILNGVALHRVYGWSIHLLGALWDSLAHFLLAVNRNDQGEAVPQDVEMQPLRPVGEPTPPVLPVRVIKERTPQPSIDQPNLKNPHLP
ncbi:hypothetical protein TKK_0016653 [Trichogramma kaykai]